jgi:hypothetical protein
MVFGLLCHGSTWQNTTLGFYKFEIKEEAKTQQKKFFISEVWSLNLKDIGLLETDFDV